jgi:hypothetical protein
LFQLSLFPASKIVCLVLRSRLELVELVQHHLFAIVFEVEYVISEPFAQPLIETKRKKVISINQSSEQISYERGGDGGTWRIHSHSVSVPCFVVIITICCDWSCMKSMGCHFNVMACCSTMSMLLVSVI